MWKKMVVLLFFGAISGFAVDKNFLLSFHQKLLDNLPLAFEAQLQGGPIEKKLSTIPKDMIASGKKPIVIIRYQKNKGMQLEVQGLTEEGRELYGDMFQPYVRVFTLGPLLLGNPTEKTWAGYMLETVAEDEKSVVLSLSLKNTVNQYILFIDKTMLRLQRIDFKGDGFFTSTILKFVEKDSYWIPEVFLNKTITKDNPDPLPDRYQLMNIRVKK